MRTLKRYSALLIIFVMVSMMMIGATLQVEAFVPALLLPVALVAVAAVIVYLGLTYLTTTDLNTAAKACWYDMPSAYKQDLWLSIKGVAVLSFFTTSALVQTWIRGWITTKYASPAVVSANQTVVSDIMHYRYINNMPFFEYSYASTTDLDNRLGYATCYEIGQDQVFYNNYEWDTTWDGAYYKIKQTSPTGAVTYTSIMQTTDTGRYKCFLLPIYRLDYTAPVSVWAVIIDTFTTSKFGSIQSIYAAAANNTVINTYDDASDVHTSATITQKYVNDNTPATVSIKKFNAVDDIVYKSSSDMTQTNQYVDITAAASAAATSAYQAAVASGHPLSTANVAATTASAVITAGGTAAQAAAAAAAVSSAVDNGGNATAVGSAASTGATAAGASSAVASAAASAASAAVPSAAANATISNSVTAAVIAAGGTQAQAQASAIAAANAMAIGDDATAVGAATYAGAIAAGATAAVAAAAQAAAVSSYASASAASNAAASSIDLTVPANVTWDFSPLMNLPIASKFPFSIPWDIQSIISPFNKTSAIPQWTINLPDPPFLGAVPFTIDFSPFEPWARIIRFFMFVFFVIGMISFTRQWIGVV